WFIELVRNTPQLVQIIFWYVAVLQTLPGPRQSVVLPGGLLLNVRGLFLPSCEPGARADVLWPLALIAVLAIPFVWRLTRRGLPLGPKSLPLAIVALGLYIAGIDRVEYPLLRGFNIAGGLQIVPELVALWAGLTIYAAAFIAEIVRASILSVHK